MGDNNRWDINIGGKIIKMGIALDYLTDDQSIEVLNGPTLINV